MSPVTEVGGSGPRIRDGSQESAEIADASIKVRRFQLPILIRTQDQPREEGVIVLASSSGGGAAALLVVIVGIGGHAIAYSGGSEQES